MGRALMVASQVFGGTTVPRAIQTILALTLIGALSGCFGPDYGPTYGYPTYPNGSINNPPYSSDPTELNSRLDDLLVKRQGLAMQWRQLEDDARDARIPQVWLEP